MPRTAPTRFLLLGLPLVLVVLFPLLALGVTAPLARVGDALLQDSVGLALRLSLGTSLTSLGISVVCGTPLAWLLSQARSRSARTLELLLELPVVIPPAVAGVALLLAFGQQGLLRLLFGEGLPSLAFSPSAVVLAQTFVSAPLFVLTAVAAFRRVDEELVLVARTLGASAWQVFIRIAVPLATPGLVAGAGMAWARALGEFGATLMFAGNLPGHTQTLPLAIYTALESDLPVAQILSLGLISVSFLLLLLLRGSVANAHLLRRTP